MIKPFKAIKNIGPMEITWIVNQSCPFHCWYCPDSVHRGVNRAYDWEDCDKFLDTVFAKYPYAHISLSGGEPTVWPYFIKMVDKVYSEDRRVSIGVNSNIMRTTDWWDRVVDKLAYIAASYHPSVVVDPQERQEWFEKVEWLNNRTHVAVRIMMDPKHWDHCLDLYDSFKKKNSRSVFIEPVRLLNYFDGMDSVKYDMDYTPEQEQILSSLDTLVTTQHRPNKVTARPYNQHNTIILEDDTEEDLPHIAPLVLNKQNKFNGWLCNMGLESLFINEHGVIKRGNCTEGPLMGQISKHDTIEWPDQPWLCGLDQCHCFTDIKLTKWKNTQKIS